MSLIKKFKVGDRVKVIKSGNRATQGCVGRIDQVNLMTGKVPFWWYGVVLENPPAGAKGGMFRDDAIKKI